MWWNYVCDNFNNVFLKASTSKTAPLSSVPCASLEGGIRVSTFDIFLILILLDQRYPSRVYILREHRSTSVDHLCPILPHDHIVEYSWIMSTDVLTYIHIYKHTIYFFLSYLYISQLHPYIFCIFWVCFQTICNIFRWTVISFGTLILAIFAQWFIYQRLTPTHYLITQFILWLSNHEIAKDTLQKMKLSKWIDLICHQCIISMARCKTAVSPKPSASSQPIIIWITSHWKY